VVKIQRLAPVTGNAASGCRGTAFDSKPPSPLALAKLQIQRSVPHRSFARKMSQFFRTLVLERIS